MHIIGLLHGASVYRINNHHKIKERKMENNANQPDIPMIKKLRACHLGGIYGGIAGYIISFFLQNSLIRMKLGFGGYLTNFYKILIPDFDMLEVAITAWIGIGAGSFVGQFIQMKLAEAGHITEPKGWARLREKADKSNSAA
jgi:hypothetical protein